MKTLIHRRQHFCQKMVLYVVWKKRTSLSFLLILIWFKHLDKWYCQFERKRAGGNKMRLTYGVPLTKSCLDMNTAAANSCSMRCWKQRTSSSSPCGISVQNSNPNFRASWVARSTTSSYNQKWCCCYSNENKQECILVGCLPTAAVTATRCW